MVIEQLSFRVPPAAQAQFLEMDAAIWTPALAAQPGFLGKEVWREADAPDALHLIIRWASRAEWKAVDTGLLAETDRQFCAAVGAVFPVLRCLDQDVI
jgi:uncharacterized protein (TIGR03792 family)